MPEWLIYLLGAATTFAGSVAGVIGAEWIGRKRDHRAFVQHIRHDRYKEMRDTLAHTSDFLFRAYQQPRGLSQSESERRDQEMARLHFDLPYSLAASAGEATSSLRKLMEKAGDPALISATAWEKILDEEPMAKETRAKIGAFQYEARKYLESEWQALERGKSE